MVFVYNHSGYLFKLPISLGTPNTEDPEDSASLWMSAAVAILANACVYFGYKSLKKKKAMAKDSEYKVAFAKYLTKLDKGNQYLRDQQIFYQSSVNTENKNLGLVIIEAYYGLADHIYAVEAGLLRFKVPETPKDFGNQ